MVIGVPVNCKLNKLCFLQRGLIIRVLYRFQEGDSFYHSLGNVIKHEGTLVRIVSEIVFRLNHFFVLQFWTEIPLVRLMSSVTFDGLVSQNK